MVTTKQYSIAFIYDQRLSRERTHIVMRAINALRLFANVDLISGNILEDELLEKVKTNRYHLVLAPWYRYISWSKIEGFYGLNRTGGPNFVGYFGDQVLPYELEKVDQTRVVLMDLSRLGTSSASDLLKALLQNSTRTGIKPLLQAETPIHCENWLSGNGMGFRIDTILSLKEVTAGNWLSRSNAIRILYSALWSLIFDEGPGKAEIGDAGTTKTPKAYFQFAADPQCLTMRLCYKMPSYKPSDTFNQFWPDANRPTASAQLLTRFADMVRVHLDPVTSDMEVVIALFPSAPAEKYPQEIHTLWIEPFSIQDVIEVPYAQPSAEDSRLRSLVTHHQLISEAAQKINELKVALIEREQTIKELKDGGLGRAQEMAPPEAEQLLEAFQERFLDARFKIRQFHHRIQALTREGNKGSEIAKLHKEMKLLHTRQQVWVSQLAQTLEKYRAERAEEKSQAQEEMEARLNPNSGVPKKKA